MKKVLFVIRSLGGGGAERVMSLITTHFPDDWEIDLLLNNKELAQFPYKGRLLSIDIPSGKGKRHTSLWNQFIAIFKRAAYMRKLKKENGYEACISFLDSSNISNILSGNKYCKTILTIHNHMISKNSSLLYRLSAAPLMKLLYNRADHIVTVSKEIELEMKKKFTFKPGQMLTIVNGFDKEFISERKKVKPETVIDTSGRQLVVTAGRLNSLKAQWHLIRAFKKVVEHNPNALLLILGQGELKDYLEELISANGLEEHVILGGFCENPFWYMDQADVFVLSSKSEGYPSALVEAICCGCACVSTDMHSGAREILAPEWDASGERVKEVTEASYGILTPVGSGIRYKGNEELEEAECQLADAINRLLSDADKREYYRRQSRIRSESMDINGIVKKWIELIEE